MIDSGNRRGGMARAPFGLISFITSPPTRPEAYAIAHPAPARHDDDWAEEKRAEEKASSPSSIIAGLVAPSIGRSGRDGGQVRTPLRPGPSSRQLLWPSRQRHFREFACYNPPVASRPAKKRSGQPGQPLRPHPLTPDEATAALLRLKLADVKILEREKPRGRRDGIIGEYP